MNNNELDANKIINSLLDSNKELMRANAYKDAQIDGLIQEVGALHNELERLNKMENDEDPKYKTKC
ncbi:hypothetical protein TPELB_21230 [Terrisporobacter petrolearius]|uniref:Phage protein n=1 Tax=Terrisporobacter petrolearius TaxID=1460447 RepID=A0ABZ3FDH1_9FIRM